MNVFCCRSRRVRTSNISYKFEEFDDLINSAIADEQVPMTEEEIAAEKAAEEERQRREAMGLPPVSKQITWIIMLGCW